MNINMYEYNECYSYWQQCISKTLAVYLGILARQLADDVHSRALDPGVRVIQLLFNPGESGPQGVGELQQHLRTRQLQ